MDKSILTTKVAAWLGKFLVAKFGENFELLEVITPESNLSKLPNETIKSMNNYSAWEFKPDVLGVLKNKDSGEVGLVLLNRSNSALSLKEIGEIYVYSKLINSKLSFLVSSNGVSNEVGILLLEDKIRHRLLNYGDGKEIIIFSWDEKNDGIISNSTIPLDKKSFLLE